VSPPLAILSPHLDDAVLSCWHLLAGPGEVLVVNVFAGVPPAGAPQGWWDALAGTGDPRDAVRSRRAEDAAALARVGRRPVNLDFLDRQYREADLPTGQLVEALLEALPQDASVYAPAAIDSHPYGPAPAAGEANAHPDHIAVRKAALALRDHGFRVRLYADLPHASAHGWPDWVAPGAATRQPDGDASARWEGALAQLGVLANGRAADVCRLSAEALARKADALKHYETQLPSLEWAFPGLLEEGGLLGYEVVWRLASPAPTPAS
jgi:LmbE family N-acetylglucosaminyl deacetylase